MTQYTNETIAHAFFYKDKDLIKANHLNLWKNNNVIYSYSTPIAILETDKNNEKILIVSSNNMTQTTSKHLNYVERANPFKQVKYPFYVDNDFLNFDSILNDLLNNLNIYQNLKNVSDCKGFIEYFNVLQNLNKHFDLNFYVDMYNSTFIKAVETLPTIKKNESLAKRQATLKFNNELKEKFSNFSVDDLKNHWFTYKETAFLKKHPDIVFNKFLNAFNHLDLIKNIYTRGFNYDLTSILKQCINDNEYSYLWVDDDKIKTSRSISLKIDVVKPFFKLWKNGKLKHGLKIDCYTVLEVTEKHVKIGCHKIPASNLKAVYNVLFN